MAACGGGARKAAATTGLMIAIAACGGSNGPTPPTTPTGGSTFTVTIANNAVSPQSLSVPRGSRVTFVNNDSRTHEIDSDPHPTHTDCPEINQIGFLSPGQSHETAALNVARVCGYHDHEQPDTRSLQGTITIQ